MNKILSGLKKKYNNKKANVLGINYIIKFKSTAEDQSLNECVGYCSFNSREIVIREDCPYLDDKTEEWLNREFAATIRHELIHAFLQESGLGTSSFSYNSPWARNEEMVDWFAMQSPKIFKVFIELDLLEKENYNE